jgi:hypothetical protein
MCAPMGEILGLMPSEISLIVVLMCVLVAYVCARGGRRAIHAYSVGIQAWDRYSSYADRELAMERSRVAWERIKRGDVG